MAIRKPVGETMNNVCVNSELKTKKLSMVELSLLHPDERLYTVALLQPLQSVDATPEYVKNRDNVSARQKHQKFLNLAFENNVDLAISPEYSCPWDVLEVALQGDCFPQEGKLWILGCESIKLNDFFSFIHKHNEIAWIHETPDPQAGTKFLDVVCCLFNAKNDESQSKRVICVQLKGQAMADHHHYIERDNLITGKNRYIFSNDENSIKLAIIICSDALSFKVTDLPAYLNTPYLIIHPQLNPQPFQNAFRLYRQIEFVSSGERKEVFTTNWARGVQITEELPANEFGGSAFYTKSDKLNLTDGRIDHNHTKGLYYSLCKQQYSHSYFFNYDEHVFILRVTKPSQDRAAHALRRRTGPEMMATYQWDTQRGEWIDCPISNDGFEQIYRDIELDISPLTDNAISPLNKERLLALSLGKVKKSRNGNWYDADKLLSFYIGDDEAIHRATVYQYRCEDEYNRRYEALNIFSKLKNQILNDPEYYPPCIRELANNYMFQYPQNGYNYNICDNNNERTATVVFMGSSAPTVAERVFDDMTSLLEEDSRSLVVWYEVGGEIKSKFKDRPLIDEDLTENRRSITREG